MHSCFSQFGIPREADDFVAAAVKAGHPRFLDEYKSIDAIDNLVNNNISVEHRLSFLKKWTDRAAELTGEEQALHQKLDPRCSAVLRGNRSLLFGEMLKHIVTILTLIWFLTYVMVFALLDGFAIDEKGRRFLCQLVSLQRIRRAFL